MTDNELMEQFVRCKTWNDPEQWEALAVMYFERGYVLNAEYCVEQAKACRVPNMSQAEVNFINTWIV